MNEVFPTVFPGNNREIRIVMVDGEPWWVAGDVCKALGIREIHVALRGLDEDEKGGCVVPTPGGEQRVSAINEPGLYSLILRSRKPEAREFKRWIIHEVLPRIRKTGAYNPAPQFEIPATYAEALMLAATQAEELEAARTAQKQAAEKIAELAPKAEAADTYMASGRNLLVRETAKMLGLREKILRQLLVERGFLFRRRNAFGDIYYDVAAPHMTAGHFVTRIYTRVDEATGRPRTTYTVYVTPKGVEAIRRVLRQLADKANTAHVRHHPRTTYALTASQAAQEDEK